MALFCSACGHSLADDARFCSACGKGVVETAFAAPLPENLVRPLAGRKIAGVCQGFALRYGWDPTLTRVTASLLTIAIAPVGLAAYFALWVIVPQEQQTALTATHFTP